MSKTAKSLDGDSGRGLRITIDTSNLPKEFMIKRPKKKNKTIVHQVENRVKRSNPSCSSLIIFRYMFRWYMLSQLWYLERGIGYNSCWPGKKKKKKSSTPQKLVQISHSLLFAAYHSKLFAVLNNMRNHTYLCPTTSASLLPQKYRVSRPKRGLSLHSIVAWNKSPIGGT